MNETYAWWGQLRHGGVLITPALLSEFWPDAPGLDAYSYGKLRDAWVRFSADEPTAEARRAFVDALLEGFLSLDGWQKGPQVAKEFKARSPAGHNLRPDRVLVDKDSKGLLALAFDDADRIGIGRGRRAHAHLVELLRATGVLLGILTNAEQLRLVFAGPDYDAWAEWDIAAWFDEGEGREQLAGLHLLLGADSYLRPEGPKVVEAIQASRSRQGELAQVLGEQVRQGVELLLGAFDASLRADEGLVQRIRKDPRTGQQLDDKKVLSAMYQAATRLVMRLVVILYAEARDLLPRSLESYHRSYGVEGLYHQLSEAARHEGLGSLEDRKSAWARMLALFDLIHAGSPHEGLPLPAYGGALFRPGDSDDPDAVLRALSAFEEVHVDDATILQILRLLKIGRLKVRKGRQNTWVAGPVDFSDLRTEYIGIVYEGLLDFELRRASDDDAIVFLNLGKEPALPLSRLESLSDDEVADLVQKLKKEKAAAAPGAEEESGDEEEVESEAEEIRDEENDADEEASEEVASEAEEAASDDDLRERVYVWAEHAAEVAKLVRKPRGKKADLAAFARERRTAAKKLVSRIVGAGNVYLVAWGGTRKGSGTFYTRPALAVPTTQRTLEPLCYTSTQDARVPRTPEEILEIKISDPAMGSGSFLVAALRYLTDALLASLLAHKRISARGDEAIATLPFGRAATGEAWEELIPVPPDDERFEVLLRARLARHVVERCIYGVDINPMAVELARLALWVETMDRELPFEFLDHKLKVGNSLVGCWLHVVEDYPAKAWEREAGDGKNGERTKWLKQVLKDRVKPELADWVTALGGQGKLFGEVKAGPTDAVRTLRERFAAIHDLPHLDREAAYRAFLDSPEYAELKRASDRWCAVWFWPPEAEPAMTPAEWRDPSTLAEEIVARVVDEMRFFHWEIEFPDVFTPDRRGFDAVIGNPPWEISKANSLEFFSNYDPLYRSYGKQEALAVQRSLFKANSWIEEEWITYQGRFKAMSNWVGSSEDPFEVNIARGNEGTALKEMWARARDRRHHVADPQHPFRHQGSADLNTYKMFLEVAHHALAEGGRLGFLVPSGIYTDKGTTTLRRLFLEQCTWEWLFGFENKQGIFPIHRMFKYNPIVVQRGGRTEAIRAAFMRHDVEEWESASPPFLELSVNDVRRFAPKTLSFLEVKDRNDLKIVEKIYGDHPLLGDIVDKLGGRYSAEFHMTNDSKLFTSRKKLEKDGLLTPEDDTRDPCVRARLRSAGYLPLYEGKCFWIHNPYFDQPSNFVLEEVAKAELPGIAWDVPRVATRNVAASTNQRTLITGLLPPCVHGNSSPSFDGLPLEDVLYLKAVLGSVVLDYVLRMKISINLNWFYLETLPVPHRTREHRLVVEGPEIVKALNCLGTEFGMDVAEPLSFSRDRFAKHLYLDALVADAFGLSVRDLRHIVNQFPIYDAEVALEARFGSCLVTVFETMLSSGARQAANVAVKLAAGREDRGERFALEDVFVPDGGWTMANREARKLLRGT